MSLPQRVLLGLLDTLALLQDGQGCLEPELGLIVLLDDVGALLANGPLRKGPSHDVEDLAQDGDVRQHGLLVGPRPVLLPVPDLRLDPELLTDRAVYGQGEDVRVLHVPHLVL